MEQLKLSNQICFPLYALSRKITALYRPLLDKIGLTYPQYLVMLVLWEHKKVTVKEIGELLWLDSGTLTPLLKRLEEKGVLLRKRSLSDERSVDIILTDEGENLKKAASAIPNELRCKISVKDNDLIMLRTQLNNLIDNLPNI